MKLQLIVVSLISLMPFWRGVLGGRIRRVNDVLGGTFSPEIVNKLELSESATRKRTPGKLRGVVENSGVCGWLLLPLFSNSTCEMDFLETTPGVYQASGYGDLTKTESIWCSCSIRLVRFVSDLFQVLVFCRSQKS